jgi:hypothetical protein
MAFYRKIKLKKRAKCKYSRFYPRVFCSFPHFNPGTLGRLGLNPPA